MLLLANNCINNCLEDCQDAKGRSDLWSSANSTEFLTHCSRDYNTMSFHWWLYSRLSINGSRPSLSPATSVRINISLQNPRLAYSNLSNIYVSVQDAQFMVRPFHLETHSVLSGKKHRHIINPFQDVLKICCWSSKLLSGYTYGEAAMNDDFPGDL